MNRSKERAQTFVVALNEYVTWDMMISLQHAEPIFLKKLFIYLASLSQLTFIIINLSWKYNLLIKTLIDKKSKTNYNTVLWDFKNHTKY